MVNKLLKMSDIILSSHEKIKSGVSQKAFVYTRPPIALNMQDQQCGLENEISLGEVPPHKPIGERVNNCLTWVSNNWLELLWCKFAIKYICGS